MSGFETLTDEEIIRRVRGGEKEGTDYLLEKYKNLVRKKARALYLIGGKEAFLVSVVRIFLSGFMFGNLASIMYSLAGGLLSLAVMLILKKTDKLSILAVSVLGGICHNIGQLIVAILVVENLKLIFYVPVLLISGFVTGLLIGIVSRVILPAVRRAYAADSAH